MDNYSVLGIQYTTSIDDVKRAYRKMAMKHHPDRGGNAEHFSKIKRAYTNIIYNLTTPDTEDEIEFNWTISDDYFDDLGYDSTETNKDLAILVPLSLEISYNGGNIDTRYELLNGTIQLVELFVPAGVRNNQLICYHGLGDNSISNIDRGDLHVTFILEEHESFWRSGDDLHTTIDISVFEAMIGATKAIKNIDGNVLTVAIPPGLPEKNEITFTGIGFININKNTAGNLIITINVDIPKITDQEIVRTLTNIHEQIYG